jgi:hypothetical protein
MEYLSIMFCATLGGRPADAHPGPAGQTAGYVKAGGER